MSDIRERGTEEPQRGLVQPFILGMQVLGILAFMTRSSVIQPRLLFDVFIALPAH